MIRGWQVWVFAVFVAVLAGRVSRVQGAPPPVFPPVPITGLDGASKYCMLQLHKQAGGTRTATYTAPYPCPTGTTSRGSMGLTLTLNTATTCDSGSPIPNGSVLEASGRVIRRGDGLVHFLGTWKIKKGVTLLFGGVIELMDRVDTHQGGFGSDPCEKQDHIEGWFVGPGEGPLSHDTLRGLIVGEGPLPPSGGTKNIHANIGGMIIHTP